MTILTHNPLSDQSRAPTYNPVTKDGFWITWASIFLVPFLVHFKPVCFLKHFYGAVTGRRHSDMSQRLSSTSMWSICSPAVSSCSGLPTFYSFPMVQSHLVFLILLTVPGHGGKPAERISDSDLWFWSHLMVRWCWNWQCSRIISWVWWKVRGRDKQVVSRNHWKSMCVSN